MHDPIDALDALQQDLTPMAEEAEARSGVDRREFVLLSLAAAAAGTLGTAGTLAAQGGRGGAAPAGGGAPQQAAPYPLGNGEAVAWTFQPYPGGTGALMEKLLRERGPAAFARGEFTVEPWTGAVPSRDEDIAFLPAHRLSALIKARRLTSTKLTQIYLARLKQYDPQLLCAVTITEELALAQAAQADREIAAGQYRGPLHGLPYGLKDLFNTKGIPTTWGSPDFVGRIIDEDAEVVVRLREAGAVLVAKLATGLYAQNDQWYRGRTNNPWNLTQGASGSSAGPGSAVPAGLCAFAIGTETQGSIVSPSIRNGVSALRPTFGRVSRHGGMVLAWSMDRVGPMCRTVEDCAMVFHVLHGADEKDPSTLTTPFAYDRGLDLSRVRIGVDPQAPAALVATLRELGARPVDIGPRPTVPGMQSALNSEYAAAFDDFVRRKAAEIGLDLNDLANAERSGPARAYGPADKAPQGPMAPADWNPRFVSGRTDTAMDFLQRQRRRHVLISRWAEFMKDLDCFIGNPTADIGPNAQTGHPCVVVPYDFAVPAGFAGGGGGGRGGAGQAAAPAPALNPQPICGVITGQLYADDIILGVAHRFQAATDFHRRRPVLG